MITAFAVLAGLFIYVGGVAFTLGFIECAGEKLDTTFYGIAACAFVGLWFIGWPVLILGGLFWRFGIKQLYALGKVVYGEGERT